MRDVAPLIRTLAQRLMFQQIIELHHLRAPMRLARPKPQRAEDPRHIRPINTVHLIRG